MEFRTEVKVDSREPKIDYESRTFLLGSCFVENIGRKMEYYKFQNLQNPFGILYHPAALENFLEKAATAYTYTEEDLFYSNERWHCFDAHSDLADPDREAALLNLNQNLARSNKFIKESTHMIITLGTAWGYKNLETAKTVGNCHKVPQKYFSKELFSVQDTIKCLKSVLFHLKQLNPFLIIIFTVSPVRHLRDGVVENQRSKAHLISALHNLLEEDEDKGGNLFYFPSYEILMDDLRDYRFYADDMLHPGPVAIDYIWEKFRETWISPAALAIMKEVEVVQKGLNHRPFFEGSSAHQTFRKNLEEKIENLKIRHSYIKF